MVRYPRDERNSLGDLANMRIRAPGGVEVPFSTVAEAEIGRGSLPELVRGLPGVSYTPEGEQREQHETLDALVRGFALALSAIFALMAIPLKSYVQPVMIMSAIPFGLDGAAWGAMILGYDLTILSEFGLVALSGVVVSDSLIMVAYINKHRRGGRDIFEVVGESEEARFRPILLTSLSTFGE